VIEGVDVVGGVLLGTGVAKPDFVLVVQPVLVQRTGAGVDDPPVEARFGRGAVLRVGRAVGPWAGLGVLAAWAAAALLGGGLLLRLRDA
jgi:ABC-2 type transport system permease protein